MLQSLAMLESDVELVLLEKVGQNDPIIWCHRMVCRKRPVDLQALNEGKV